VGLGEGEGKPPLAHALLLALADLLFCPEFTVSGGGHKVRCRVRRSFSVEAKRCEN
jgi:hypothetical protein